MPKTETLAETYPAPRVAWTVTASLTFGYLVSFIDRQILNLLVTPIKADLGVSDTQMGLLIGLAFSVFYTGMGLVLGRLADTMNRVKLISIGVAAWSAMTAASNARSGNGSAIASPRWNRACSASSRFRA